ncbi:uncharacterized protein NEMAJ01_0382 [Nematocida major]|uniref:uncharacterized protein n=1 Tax=Nematocida major TaxID=1912982 RepID=UPI0020083BFF|nr:uncharacterized protein NEMAJ01_0382 [Nematocida major]KAH9385486.1 hypothetical protein NEMAJ01_0382 [Nematocida major]
MPLSPHITGIKSLYYLVVGFEISLLAGFFITGVRHLQILYQTMGLPTYKSMREEGIPRAHSTSDKRHVLLLKILLCAFILGIFLLLEIFATKGMLLLFVGLVGLTYSSVLNLIVPIAASAIPYTQVSRPAPGSRRHRLNICGIFTHLICVSIILLFGYYWMKSTMLKRHDQPCLLEVLPSQQQNGTL